MTFFYLTRCYCLILIPFGASDSLLKSLQREKQLLKISKPNSKHTMRKPQENDYPYSKEKKSPNKRRRERKSKYDHISPMSLHFSLYLSILAPYHST